MIAAIAIIELGRTVLRTPGRSQIVEGAPTAAPGAEGRGTGTTVCLFSSPDRPNPLMQVSDCCKVLGLLVPFAWSAGVPSDISAGTVDHRSAARLGVEESSGSGRLQQGDVDLGSMGPRQHSSQTIHGDQSEGWWELLRPPPALMGAGDLPTGPGCRLNVDVSASHVRHRTAGKVAATNPQRRSLVSPAGRGHCQVWSRGCYGDLGPPSLVWSLLRRWSGAGDERCCGTKAGAYRRLARRYLGVPSRRQRRRNHQDDNSPLPVHPQMPA